jgi:hypothetical protein
MRNCTVTYVKAAPLPRRTSGFRAVVPIAVAVITALVLSAAPSFAGPKAGICTTKSCVAKARAAKIAAHKVAVARAKAAAAAAMGTLSPIPIPTPTPIPYACSADAIASTGAASNQSLSGSLAKCAYNEISKQLESQPPATLQIAVVLTPNAITRLLAPTLKSLKDGLRFWQQVTPPGTSVEVVFASNSDWAWFKERMTLLQPTNAAWLAPLEVRSGACPLCQYGGYNGGTVDGKQLYWFMPTAQTDPTNFGWAGAGPHEWTHFAQQALLGDINLIPCWLKEGQATYYGDSIATRDEAAWVVAWRSGIRTLDQNGLPSYRTLNQAQILEWFNSHDETIPATSCGPGGAFFMGAMASEYLLGTLGHDGIVHLFENIAQTKDWRMSLSRSLKEPISQVMDQIAQFVGTERDWALKDN